jgi:hypothetical protein
VDSGSSVVAGVKTSFYAFDDVAKCLSKRAMVQGYGVDASLLEADESSKAAYRGMEEKLQKRKRL